MSKIDDGGPAFPYEDRSADGTRFRLYTGMTLRQYYVGQAVVGLLADTHTELNTRAACAVVAKAAVIMADELIKAERGEK